MSIVVAGQEEDVPGAQTLNWKEDAKLCLNPDHCAQRPANRWIRASVLHTTQGFPDSKHPRPQTLLSGLGHAKGPCDDLAAYGANDGRSASAHLLVDCDGSAACMADLSTQFTYHAAQHEVNQISIGIEIFQSTAAELYEGQLDAVVLLVDYLTRRFGIQRQFHSPYHNRPVTRLAAGELDVIGNYGHRDVSGNRGFGDPGDYVFEKLAAAGHEAFDFEANEDLAAWKQRQEDLNARYGAGLEADGIPGPKTRIALTQAAKARGLWVSRPGD